MPDEEKKIDDEFKLLDEDYERFYSLVQLLVDNGYDVKVSHKVMEDEYYYQCTSLSTGGRYSVRFAFCTPSTHVYKCLSGGISADHIDSFDKWSKCPCKIPLPSNEDEERLIIMYLAWLGSEAGYVQSENYDFDYFIF